MLRESLLRVLDGYLPARADEFTDHPMAIFVRDDLREELRQLTPASDRFWWNSSAGKGQWTFCPWVAAGDPLISDNVQTGVYPVYLFHEGMSGVWLSLNQGMTELRALHGVDAKRVMQSLARHYVELLGPVSRFPDVGPIDLGAESGSSRTAFYEAGNILARWYPADAMPAEVDLVRDWRIMLDTYGALIELMPFENPRVEGNGGTSLVAEDYRKQRLHRGFDRKYSDRVKREQGHVCKACGMDANRVYGPDVARDYVEAHHLVPMNQLSGTVVQRDLLKDFAVLCANCHAMIHRSHDPSDVAGLRERINFAAFPRG